MRINKTKMIVACLAGLALSATGLYAQDATGTPGSSSSTSSTLDQSSNSNTSNPISSEATTATSGGTSGAALRTGSDNYRDTSSSSMTGSSSDTDRGYNYSWIGLLGLAGLAGLMPQGRPTTTKSANSGYAAGGSTTH